MSEKRGIAQSPTKTKAAASLRAGALVLLVLVSWVYISKPISVNLRTGLASNVNASLTSADVFSWQALTPSNKLEWNPCDDSFECARFLVPLDYSDRTGAQAAIALKKLPAKTSSASQKQKEPVFIIPGGPGDSGVEFLTVLGSSFHQIIGEDYDLIGLDNRGVGQTTPEVRLFNTTADYTAWALNAPLTAHSPGKPLSYVYAHYNMYGQLASSRVKDTLQYVGTASVARDLAEIIQAVGTDKLNAWAFSYGTVLAQTFASMFPNRVGRLAVDGVVDIQNFQENWTHNLIDTDKTLGHFYSACSAASPNSCALHEQTGDEVKARTEAIFDDLRRRPLPVVGNDTSSDYGIVDYELVRAAVFEFLYAPLGGPAPIMASALAALERGDALPMWRLARHLRPSNFDCDCGHPDVLPSSRRELQVAVMCGDAEPVKDGVKELEEYYERLGRVSGFADAWRWRAVCAGWKERSIDRFTGPFVANTSHPMLFIGNTADPVSPLAGAVKMSKGFRGAVVLTQDSACHCSLNTVSACTFRHIRQYFRSGILPEAGTICPVEERMFEEEGFQRPEFWNDPDSIVEDAVKAFRSAMRTSSFWI